MLSPRRTPYREAREECLRVNCSRNETLCALARVCFEHKDHLFAPGSAPHDPNYDRLLADIDAFPGGPSYQDASKSEPYFARRLPSIRLEGTEP